MNDSDLELCMCFSPDCEKCWGELAITPDPEPVEWFDLGGEG